MGPNKGNPQELTKTNSYTIDYSDQFNLKKIIIRIQASDGQYTDYQDFHPGRCNQRVPQGLFP